MSSHDWDGFLQWAFPRMELRFRGYRRVRKQVVKRVRRRIAALGLPDVRAYRAYLEREPGEWAVLEPLCRITVSRFRRDRAVFDLLRDDVLPRLGDRLETVEVWSAGCASGEEPYSLALTWLLDLAGQTERLRILATDADAALLKRARRATYASGTLREVPEHWLTAFEETGEGYVLRPAFREPVRFAVGDLRDLVKTPADRTPARSFALIACRNLAFTYFEPSLQRRVLRVLAERLLPDGCLVLGSHESLPEGAEGFEVVRRGVPVLLKRSSVLGSR